MVALLDDLVVLQHCCVVGNEVVCQHCELSMGKVPGQAYNYSDHEGVAAELVLKRNVTGEYWFLVLTSLVSTGS